jgi:predicted MPP superfamily phosphohydrolase
VRLERGRGSLWLGGVDDPSRGSLGPDPVRALRGAAPEEPRIVLAHRPSLFELCSRAGAGLVLSGHTHGGQIALSPRWSLARLLGPYTMGYFEKDGAQLYVHRGMGTVSPAPLRLGSPPELALLTLRRS